MNADELRALAERVQGLDGPDREVDDAAAEFAGWKRVQFGPEQRDGWRNPFGNLSVGPPQFTASLDAAMTLVPDGWCWCAADYKGEANPAVWQGIYQNAKGFASLTALDDAMTNIRTYAATPALALTAAALLARATLLQS